jgi:hypothetical protein
VESLGAVLCSLTLDGCLGGDAFAALGLGPAAAAAAAGLSGGGESARAWVVAALGEGPAGLLDVAFRERALEALAALTRASAASAADAFAADAAASAAAAPYPGIGARRAGYKRRAKVVLKDLAAVCVGEANADDCFYDLTDLSF